MTRHNVIPATNFARIWNMRRTTRERVAALQHFALRCGYRVPTYAGCLNRAKYFRSRGVELKRDRPDYQRLDVPKLNRAASAERE